MTPGSKLRALIAQPDIALLPGAYDALSARIIAAAGFEGLCAGGFAATGARLGEPDTGQMTVLDYADHYGRIVDAVDLPVFVDADTGGGGVNNVRRTVRAFEKAGVAGLFIEDQIFPKRCGYMAGKAVIPTDQMLAKIKAALDARVNPDLVIVARTDALGIEGIDAAIARAQLYAAAGADLTFVQGADSIADFARICREVPGRQFANISQAAGERGFPSLADLQEAGAAAVTFPSLALFAAVQAVANTMRTLRQEGLNAITKDSLIPLKNYNDLIGLAAQQAREDGYAAAAQTLLHPPHRNVA
jgi:methylisocitrate lyase